MRLVRKHNISGSHSVLFSCSREKMPGSSYPCWPVSWRPEETEEECSDQSMPARLTDLDENSIPFFSGLCSVKQLHLDILPCKRHYHWRKVSERYCPKELWISCGQWPNFCWVKKKLWPKWISMGKGKGKDVTETTARHSLVHLYIDNYVQLIFFDIRLQVIKLLITKWFWLLKISIKLSK